MFFFCKRDKINLSSFRIHPCSRARTLNDWSLIGCRKTRLRGFPIGLWAGIIWKYQLACKTLKRVFYCDHFPKLAISAAPLSDPGTGS